MDYTFTPARGLMKQLADWLWFWAMIGIIVVIVAVIAYGMGKSDSSIGGNNRVGAVENTERK